jgi:hypothetical protein
MKGYVQRLVAAAVRPGGNVHPLVGSRFPAARSAAEASPQIEEVLLADAGPRIGTRTGQEVSRPAGERTQRQTAAWAGDPGDGLPSAARGHETAPFQPLLPNARRDAAPPAIYTGADADSDASADHGERAPAVRDERQPETPPHERELAERIVFEGLPAHSGDAELFRSLRQPLREGEASFGLNRGRRMTPAYARQAPPSAPSADEIQIHIGRIEVTAVPPPAARPPAPAVRKGPTLSEYLSRRDGRGR